MNIHNLRPQAALDILRPLKHHGDPEAAHSIADDVLIDLIRTYVPMGADIAKAWNEIEKRYA